MTADTPDAERHGQEPTAEDRTAEQEQRGFPIVGIGASAGGLEALEQLFTAMADDTGAAFVLVQHLDPTHKSAMPDLLQRYTDMTVSQAEEGVAVKPNHLYIIPPNRTLSIYHGALHLTEPAEPRGQRAPIDSFFRSLAQDQGPRAIGIVLSGTGTEGTQGLKEIKGAGGLAVVQDPETAAYDGMPRNAVASGQADYVLAPREMPEYLTAYIRQQPLAAPEATTSGGRDRMQRVFALLRDRTGHDFSLYKRKTVHRRVSRRMIVNQISDLDGYVRYLKENPNEVQLLFRELLIEVTSFFRDPEAFQVLAEEVIPTLLEDRDPDDAVRAWVPGCSTGEEAYSIAILLREAMDERGTDYKVQMFATDINSEAIETARMGLYPDSIRADVSDERLQRFFSHKDDRYRIRKNIREMVVFAEQDVTKDPPFSSLDLITCRNLLIYMRPELQKKLIPLFHYALKEDGFLFLGSAESVGELTRLFATVNRKWKIFTPRPVEPGEVSVAFPSLPPSMGKATAAAKRPRPRGPKRQLSYQELAERTLLADYAPVCILTDEKGDILYIHGRSGQYLEPAAGEASLNLLEMARRGLRASVSTAFRKARKEQETVHRKGVRVTTNGATEIVDLTVRPITEPPAYRGLLLILLEHVEPPEEEGQGSVSRPEPDETESERVKELEHELRSTKEYLQTTVEELETSNEELQSTNEELQSSNEELQSTNEELETSKEELQSVNEELMTVNAELEDKNKELNRTNDDLRNLMAASEVGIVLLDTDLRIRRFTPAATEALNLIEGDVGRPIGHVVSNLEYEDMVADIQQVLDNLAPMEKEVNSKEDRHYSVRITPYRTAENVIDGAVLTFVDVTERRSGEELREDLRAARTEARMAEAILDTVREPLLILDPDLRVTHANHVFYVHFRAAPEETEGRLVYNLGNGQWDIPRLRELLGHILPRETSFEDFRVEHRFPGIGPRTVLLNARQVENEEGDPERILLAIEDVTEREDAG